MIAPDMATMLSFIFTDAAIAAPALQALVKENVTDTFNAVTIDGDTSTSDTLMMFATGQAKDCPRITRAADPRLKAFKKALHQVLANLSEQIARDGEGARKLVEIKVEGAVSNASARRIAMSIANSPLVKTAIAGEDANWGRVVMAVGKAGEPADRDKLSIWFGGIRVAHKGARDPAYNEAKVSVEMKKPEIYPQSRARPWQRPRPGADLRPDQGIHRHQRRLPVLIATFNLLRDRDLNPDPRIHRAVRLVETATRVSECIAADKSRPRPISQAADRARREGAMRWPRQNINRIGRTRRAETYSAGLPLFHGHIAVNGLVIDPSDIGHAAGHCRLSKQNKQRGPHS